MEIHIDYIWMWIVVFGLFLGGLIFLTGKLKWFVRIIEENMHNKSRRYKRGTRKQRARRD